METQKNPGKNSLGFEIPLVTDLMGRLKETFIVIKKHIVPLFVMPLVIFLAIQFLASIILSLVLKNSTSFDLSQLFNASLSGENVQYDLGFLATGLIVMVAVYLVGGIFLALVPAYNISEIYHGRSTSWESAFAYAKNNIIRYFSVVWHSFLYVLLVPVVLMISGLLLTSIIPILGSLVGLAGAITFIYFLIVRGFRIFAILYIAVDEDLNGKQALEKSKQITYKRLSDIFVNMLALVVLSFLISYVFGLIGRPVLNSVVSSYDFDGLLDALDNPFSLFNIVQNIFGALESAIGIAIGATFTYMLFKALEKFKIKNPDNPGKITSA